jgi:hypothetical protein
MKPRWFLSVMFLLPAAGAGYMTWLSWQAGDDGQWFFGVMAVFFLLLVFTPFLPARKKTSATEPPSPPNTRFVPHWFILLVILAIIVCAVLAVVTAVVRH